MRWADIIVAEVSALEKMAVPQHRAYTSQGRRAEMEDRTLALPLSPHLNLYLVCDGHKGCDVVDGLIDALPDVLAKIDWLAEEPELARQIAQAFINLDVELYQRGASAGSTLSGALVFKDEKVILLNVGDSRTALIQGRRLKVVTPLHKPNVEAERVKAAGGTVINNRVNGYLAMSRAFGDYQLGKISEGKYQVGGPLTVLPTFIKAPYYEGGQLIIATDGFWDVVKPESLPRLPCHDPRQLADLAYRRGSCDNIAVMVVGL